jgi:aspartate/methionine/tyrosine aminotransferase
VIKPSLRWAFTKEGSREAFDDAVAKRKAAGKEVTRIEAGDPVVWGFTAQNLSNHLIQAAEDGWHMYPQSTTFEKDLRIAVAEFEKRFRDVEYSPDAIVVAPGTAAVMAVLHYALLDQGDEVVTWDPSHHLTGPTRYWSYLGATAVPCRTLEEEDWKPDVDEMKKKITTRTKAIFVNSPNNPTGAVYDEKVLREIINVAAQYDIPMISDEIYGLITLDGVKSPSVSTLSEEVPVIMLSGMSKIFMRTGWRVGYMCIHDPTGSMKDATKSIKKVAKMYGHGTTCMPTPILAAAAKVYAEAVEQGLSESYSMIHELELRRNYTMKRFGEMSGITCRKPMGALYAFPRIQGIGKVWRNDKEFLLDLLEEEGLLLDSGSAYGTLGEGHVRLLLMPKMEILEKVYDGLDRFLKKRGTGQ